MHNEIVENPIDIAEISLDTTSEATTPAEIVVFRNPRKVHVLLDVCHDI
jgi:hypothetical protein